MVCIRCWRGGKTLGKKQGCSLGHVQTVERFTRGERVKFLREVATELRRSDLKHAMVLTVRNNGEICDLLLRRMYINDVLAILERVKQERFANWRDGEEC